MYIARRISTQEWINDFQEGATPQTLTQNAVNAGIPVEDVEVLNLSLVEYEAAKESVLAPLRIIVAQETELTRQQMINVINQARTAWGFTKPQMKLLVQAIRQIAEGDLD